MPRCAFFIALACIFGASRIDLIFNDQSRNESETATERKTGNQNHPSTKSKMAFEAPPPGDYLCNNLTFDWMVQTLVSKIAQLTETIKETEQELRWFQEAYVEQEAFFRKYVTQITERYEQELDEVKQQAARKPKDCADVQGNGYHYNGIYKIYPSSNHLHQPANPPSIQDYSESGMDVFCDMDAENGGWTVIQRRIDGKEGFDRSWIEYKEGFGDLVNEFWMGNDKIHTLTQQRRYVLRIDMVDSNGSHFYAHYEDFYIESEKNNYRLHLGRFSGNAGDALATHSDQQFSTVDNDNDLSRSGNCAELYGGGGWWYERCYDSNLNGKYGDHLGQQGIVWYTLNYDHQPLQHVSMKIRPSNFKPDSR